MDERQDRSTIWLLRRILCPAEFRSHDLQEARCHIFQSEMPSMRVFRHSNAGILSIVTVTSNKSSLAAWSILLNSHCITYPFPDKLNIDPGTKEHERAHSNGWAEHNLIHWECREHFLPESPRAPIALPRKNLWTKCDAAIFSIFPNFNFP